MKTDTQDIRLARAQLLRVADPEDPYTALCIELFGSLTAAQLLTGTKILSSEEATIIARHTDVQKFVQALSQRTERWKKRQDGITTEQEQRFAQNVGAWLLIPEDDDWPVALNDLGPKAPYALWGRGDRSKLAELTLNNCVSVVGSRDTTTYGNSATTHLVGELATRGHTIISGGAFGIDAVAHRTALATSTGSLPTIALMAGGLDRLYPKQNENLLQEIIRTGVVLSEVPLGYSPTRWRFLQRNRLIAALSYSTVVVEARWRSGALNTAHHALDIGRELYAVPGPIFSPTSEGCHRLISDGLATLCTGAEIITTHHHLDPETEEKDTAEIQLSEVQQRVWDALPLRQFGTVDTMSSMVGIDSRTLMMALSQLKALGIAESNGVGWRKHVSTT